MILTLEELRAATKRFNTKEAEIKEIGGSVYVRQVTAGELDELQQMCKQVSEGRYPMFRAKCAAIFLSDENGKRLYTDAQVDLLNNMNGRAIDQIFEAGMAFNSVIDYPLEELEKN